MVKGECRWNQLNNTYYIAYIKYVHIKLSLVPLEKITIVIVLVSVGQARGFSLKAPESLQHLPTQGSWDNYRFQRGLAQYIELVTERIKRPQHAQLFSFQSVQEYQNHEVNI